MKLTPKMELAIQLAHQGDLICSYGNQFFVSGSAGRETVERAILEALVKRGLLVKKPDMTGRGRYVLAGKVQA